MTAINLDPETRNNDIGLYWTRTRRVDPAGGGLPYAIGELATGLTVGTAGTVVWYNKYTDETGVMSFEAGEWKPIAFTEILATATIDGQIENTTATNMFWTSSSANLGHKR